MSTIFLRVCRHVDTEFGVFLRWVRARGGSSRRGSHGSGRSRSWRSFSRPRAPRQRKYALLPPPSGVTGYHTLTLAVCLCLSPSCLLTDTLTHSLSLSHTHTLSLRLSPTLPPTLPVAFFLSICPSLSFSVGLSNDHALSFSDTSSVLNQRSPVVRWVSIIKTLIIINIIIINNNIIMINNN
eukprot:COSAG05_NODE_584_length_8527_cov_46.366279_2_plen_182_part_00